MPDTMLLIEMLVMLLVIGAFAGVLAGLLGVGGGIVLVPAFFYAFQTLGYGGPQLMQICLATSLATIIVTSVRSVLSHNKKGAVEWSILRTWAPGIAVGAVIGVLVAASLRSSTLQGVFGVLGIIVGLYLGFGRAHWRLGPQMPAGITRAVTVTNATRFTAPNVSGGRFSGAISRNRKPITDGNAIVTPNPAAVATARWIGTP